MSGTSRPTLPDGSPRGLTSEVSGEALKDRPTNPRASDVCGRVAPHSAADSRGGLQVRPYRSPRRSSSGYFSNDSESLPSSPLSPRPPTASTQTPSPSAQVIEHALHRLEHGLGESAQQPQQEAQQLQPQQQQQAHGRNAPSGRPSNSMRDMQAVLIGQELRRHGDEFNRILVQRRQAAGGDPQWRPVVHRAREPTVFLCVGLLIFFFGRLLYSHGTAYNQSQV